MLKATNDVDGVTVVDLYGEYPTHHIDIEQEQARLREHDVIVFMFPMYWYSTPAILKEWQDLVLEYGFAYGEEGNALQGKLFLCALTAGATRESYASDGYNSFTLNQLLQPLQQTAVLCGMQYLPPFALYGARTALEEGRISAHTDNWKKLLAALRDDRLDLVQAAQRLHLNDDLTTLLEVAQ